MLRLSDQLKQLIDSVSSVSAVFDQGFYNNANQIKTLVGEVSANVTAGSLAAYGVSFRDTSTTKSSSTLRYECDRETATVELSHDQWHHVALTMSWDVENTNYQVKQYVDGNPKRLYDADGNVRSTFNHSRTKLPTEAEILFGKTGEDRTGKGLEVYLSEFQMWNKARDQRDIERRKQSRIPGDRNGYYSDGKIAVFAVPFSPNQVPSGITLVDSSRLVSEPGKNSELKFITSSLTLIENRERVLVFYGDNIGAFRDTLDDQKFILELRAVDPKNTSLSKSYDLDLRSSQLVVAETNGLSFNDYAKNSYSTLNRYDPNQWQRLSKIVKDNADNGLFKSDAEFLATLTSSSTPPKLPVLKALSLFETSLSDVNNRPGWYVLDTGDEQLLVTTTLNPKTTRSRMQFEYVPNLAGEETPQPLAVTLTDDSVLQIPSAATSPPFQLKFERLSSYAVHTLGRSLFRGGIPELLSLASQSTSEWSFDTYKPVAGMAIAPTKTSIDFDGSLGLYYWEIFFHIPFLIANKLNADQNFAEAQQWYHYIFNPTTREAATETKPSDRYWQYLPFRQQTLPDLKAILTQTGALEAYRDNPFDPHAIANLRRSAYQKAVVMKYIDNLLDWGDSLFRADTRESVNEATMLYVLAYNLLGARPKGKTIQRFEEVGSYQTFTSANPSSPEFLSDLETSAANGSTSGVYSPHYSLISNFCVPENEKFIGYWDRVEDRFFKIRHSLNIDGAFRQLALFDPPIDPMELVRAVAGGRGLSSALSDLRMPVPHYRYTFLLDKAQDMVGTVIELGSALLAAIESKDAARLEVLQNNHERSLLNLTTAVKKAEIEAIKTTIEAIEVTLNSVQVRIDHLTMQTNRNLTAAETHAWNLNLAAIPFKATAAIFEYLAGITKTTPEIENGVAGVFGSPVAIIGIDGDMLASIFEATGKVGSITADVLEGAAGLVEKNAEYERRLEEWKHEKSLAEWEKQEIEKQITIAKIQQWIAEKDLQIHEATIRQNEEIGSFYRSKFTNESLYTWMTGKLSALYFQTFKVAYDMAKSAEKALQFELPTTETFITPVHWDSLRKGLLAGESLRLELNRMEKAHIDQDSRFLEMEKVISMKKSFPDALKNLKEPTVSRCEFKLDEALFDRDFPGHYCRLIKVISFSILVELQSDDEMEVAVDRKVKAEGLTGEDADIRRRELLSTMRKKQEDEIKERQLKSVNAIVTQLSSKTLLKPDMSALQYLLGHQDNLPTEDVLRVNWRANQQIAISRAEENSGTFGNFDLNILFDERYFPFELEFGLIRKEEGSWRLALTAVRSMKKQSSLTL